MLIDVNMYKDSLKKLWSETFGDDGEYVNLFFDYDYTAAECFAQLSEGEVISVLYLLKGYITAEGKSFEGRYLYAAATDLKHRGKGIMSKLIREAQEYIKKKKLSFICLVPADDGLYDYYARFGFEALMKNYVSEAGDKAFSDERTSAELKEYLSARSELTVPYFSFAENEWKYAFSCLSHTDYIIIRNTQDSYYIIDEDENEVLEYISSHKNFRQNTEKFFDKLSEGTTVVSPYDLSDFCECNEKRFGMIYSADDFLNKYIYGGVYMNIALD